MSRLREPWRSRLWIGAGLALAPVTASVAARAPFTGLAFTGAAILGGMVIASRSLTRDVDFTNRKPEFTVTESGLVAQPLTPPGNVVPIFALMASGPIANAPWVLRLLIGAMLLLVAAHTWSGHILTLTPEGIRWTGWLPRRAFLAWPELAPGGPPPPSPHDFTLIMPLRKGGRRRLPHNFDVDPRVIATAIRLHKVRP